MKKKITCLLLIGLLFVVTFGLVGSPLEIRAEEQSEEWEMHFLTGALTIEAGGSASTSVSISISGATVRFTQTAIAGINLRPSGNSCEVRVASDMPAGSYWLIATYNGRSIMLAINVTEPHRCEYTESIVREASCTSAGLKVYSCNCGASYEEAISRLEHNYSEQVVEPTCSRAGYTKHTCSLCRDSYKTDEIPKLEHVVEVLPAVETSCSAPGRTEGAKCSVCDEVLTPQEEIAKFPHTFSDWRRVSNPTCSAEGSDQRRCGVCGTSESRGVQKLPHTEILGGTKGAHLKCAVCDTGLSTAHAYSINIVKAATCTEKGKNAYVCSCGYSYEETTALKKHADLNDNGYCDDCNKLISKNKANKAKEFQSHITCVDCGGNKKSIAVLKKCDICRGTGLKKVLKKAESQLVFKNKRFLLASCFADDAWEITECECAAIVKEMNKVCETCGRKGMMDIRIKLTGLSMGDLMSGKYQKESPNVHGNCDLCKEETFVLFLCNECHTATEERECAQCNNSAEFSQICVRCIR